VLRLITWNVARRSSRFVEQATALATREPDLVALQEITRRTLPLWQRAFELMGLPHVRASLTSRPLNDARASTGRARRSDGVMVASRASICGEGTVLPVPWPETALSVVTAPDGRAVELHNVHVPNAANGFVKVKTLQAIRRGLETAPPARRVLCGDLNTPRRELADGHVISFARDTRGRLRDDRGPDWDAAELSLVPGLSQLGYRDVYRAVHGYSRSDPSWTWKQIAGHGGGWRIDHIFASDLLRPATCVYHHDWRDSGWSDHSALEADLE
jgi:endonuclease/exonuclease/phosphatase family metal-dependent hydrolase